ncbi:unnamed protein product [Heterobilharzia americana]|nr:unnamed protein product [Heterobilharzia americana]
MPTDSDMDNYRILAEKGRKKILNLPFDKIFTALKEFSGRFSFNVCVYIVAIAEHVIGNFLQAAICYEDKALTENVIRASTVETLFILYRDRVKPRRLVTANLFPQDYDKCVDELCSFLQTCLEQMNLLIRVFREPILSLTPSSYQQQMTTTTTSTTPGSAANEDFTQVLFGSMLDVYNNMRILLDTIEAEDEDNYSPNITTKSKDCQLSTPSMIKSINTFNSTSTNRLNDTSSTMTYPSSETFATLDSIPEKQMSGNHDSVNNENRHNHKNCVNVYSSNKKSLSPTLPSRHSSSPTFHSVCPSCPTIVDDPRRHHHQLNKREEEEDHSISSDHATNNNYMNNSKKTHPRRLVGICLIELAEDDSLHAFSQYATIALDSNSRDRAWNSIEHESYVHELCQLSRSIVHTVSLNNKYPGHNFISSLSTTDLHSFTCSRCQYWDTVVGMPRRRSTSSSIASPIRNDNTPSNSFNKDTMSTSIDSADKIELTSKTSHRHHNHRSPHLSSSDMCATNCNYLVNATRYLLPRLILLPIFHFFYFHELIETLHRCAYDDEDRARLKEVLSMLSKTRSTLERDLAKHPWVALHLVRLISTGQLTNRYRSLYLNAVTGASCPPSPVNYTAPPSPVGPSNQIGSHVSCASVFNASCNSSGNIFNYHNPHHSTGSTGAVTITPTVGSINSTDLPFIYNNTIQSKADEIEKLLCGKDKLSMPSNCRSALGDFVLESRVHLRTESKKSSSEHIAYLFTGLLLICKWQERRSTPLNPTSMQQSVLRVKHRIPLDLIHVTDLPPIVQPNLTGYVGHSGPMTPSLVGAAVLAATSANSYPHSSSSTVSSHEDTSSVGMSGLFTFSLNGSMSSHSSLASAGGSGISSFPFLFKLEYVDSNSCSPSSHRSNHSNSRHHNHHHHGYHVSPQKSSSKMNFSDEIATMNGGSDANSILASLSSTNNTSEKVGLTNLSSSGINVNHIWIFLRTPEEKADWIASLLSIQVYRLFLRYIRTLPRLEVSLRLPSPYVYRFSQPDNVNNIIFEANTSASVPHPQADVYYSSHAKMNRNSLYHNHSHYHIEESHKSPSVLQSVDDPVNTVNSPDNNCLSESADFLYTSDDAAADVEGEVEEEEVEDDDDVELIESQTLTSGSVVVVSPPVDLTSRQPSPLSMTTTTIPSFLSGSPNVNTVNSISTGCGHSAVMSSESHERLDSVNIMLTLLNKSDSSSTLTLTSHGSNDSSNISRTLINCSRNNTIKSQHDYPPRHQKRSQQQQSSQSPNRFPEIVNMHTNRHYPNAVNFPPQIRMATLDKLIERLTYPTYFDTRLVNCFLLVYRRVTTSEELLNLLIERFRIPDPEFLPEEWNIETEHGQLESPAQHMLKRFRSGYKKRIQSRVLMFLSRWVRSTRYYQNDFLPNPELRQKLLDFLSTIQSRYLLSSVERIKQHLQHHATVSTIHCPVASFQETITTMTSPTAAKTSIESIRENIVTSDSVPVSPVESNFSWKSDSIRNTDNRSRVTLHNIHPYKLAEQVTLYEWELYRRIPFWEVESRDRTGDAVPNLNKSKSFSNRFRNWLVYSVLSESNPDDRVSGIQRVIDLMLIMEHMNNLQGSQEAKSALISAAVYRLRKSFQVIRRMRHYRDTVDRLRREGVTSPKHQRTCSSPSSSSSASLQTNSITDQNISGNNSTNNINNINNNNSNTSGNNSNSNSSNNPFSGFGLPFSTRASKSHERRIRVLEKQHASGELCHPCVPFIAAGVMTRLIHLDLRHPDTIVNNAGNVMINCWKHRQLAEIVERYLAFQRIPYTYDVDNEVREFLEHVDPLKMAGVTSEAEFERKMYELSESYEPRESEPLNEPIIPEERHMTKEEIQAAQLLSNSSLKERMSVQSMAQFSNLLNSQHNNNNSGNNSNNKSPSLSLLSPSTLISPSISTNEPKNSSKKSGLNLPSSLIGIGNDKHIQSEVQERKYLRIPPNPLSLSANTTSGTLALGPKHQHSMSDSHVISSVITPCHHATNSVIGVTTTYSAGLSPPSTPHSTNCGHSQHPPPPLPPRQRRQSCNCSRYVKTPNSVSANTCASHRNPTPPPPPQPHSPNATRSPFLSSATDSCSCCFPPPLPPKPSSSNRSVVVVVATTTSTPALTSITSHTHSRTSDECSPYHSNNQSFTFNVDSYANPKCLPIETAPPLPPKRNTTNTIALNASCSVHSKSP